MAVAQAYLAVLCPMQCDSASGRMCDRGRAIANDRPARCNRPPHMAERYDEPYPREPYRGERGHGRDERGFDPRVSTEIRPEFDEEEAVRHREAGEAERRRARHADRLYRRDYGPYDYGWASQRIRGCRGHGRGLLGSDTRTPGSLHRHRRPMGRNHARRDDRRRHASLAERRSLPLGERRNVSRHFNRSQRHPRGFSGLTRSCKC